MSSSQNWSLLQWQENEATQAALWRADSTMTAPRRIVIADDSLSADSAYRLACEGQAMLWRGDFQNARQLLSALGRRLDKPARETSAKARHRRAGKEDAKPVFPHAFHLHRQALAQQARILSSVMIELDASWHCALRRAPDWSEACREAWGDIPADQGARSVIVPLRELLGALGAHEWRKKGVALAVPGMPEFSIHPHYGVFSRCAASTWIWWRRRPAGRSPAGRCRSLGYRHGHGCAFRSLAAPWRAAGGGHRPERPGPGLCAGQPAATGIGAAREPAQGRPVHRRPGRPGGLQSTVVAGQGQLLLEQAVYDEGSRMLRSFVQGLAAHLLPGGEGWLILSDLAEHLQLRSREQLLEWIEAAGLQVLGREDIRPRHGKAADAVDPLHAARAAEVTSLWRLAPR